MHGSVKRDIKRVLNGAYSAVRRKKYYRLDKLSNQLNHSAAIHQSKEISLCSAVVFALSKLFTNRDYFEHSGFSKFREAVLSNLKRAKKALRANKIGQYMQRLRSIENKIEQIDKKVKAYQEPLMQYSRAKKAAHAVEHGLSINQASRLFDVPEWDITRHTGKSTEVGKRAAPAKTNRARIKLVKRLFNV